MAKMAVPAAAPAAVQSAFATWEWDLSSGVVSYSGRWRTMLGLPADAVQGTLEDWFERVAADDVDWVRATIEGQVDAGDEFFQIEYRIADVSGRLVWMHCEGSSLCDADGRVLRVVGLQTNIDARKRGEDALRASEERYALAMRASSDGLWDYDALGGHLYLAARWYQMLGLEPSAGTVSLATWLDRIHPDDRPWVEAALEADSETFELEYRIAAADGSWRWMLCHGLLVRDGDGAITRIAGSQSDISRRKKAETQLLHDAFHDALTGLPNRPVFLDRVRQALARCRSSQEHGHGLRCAVIILDIDRFDVINQTLGHDAGDRLLRELTVRLQLGIDSADTLARLDADQFALLADGLTDGAAIADRVRRIQHRLVRPFRIDEREIFVTISFGSTSSEVGYTEPETALRDAGIALAKAKRAGRGGHEVFDSSVHARVVDILQLESHLRRALEEDDQIIPFYQPIVDIATGELAGFEALVRWLHPTRGVISPAEFVPLAEETGIVIQLGLVVLSQACRQIARWSRLREKPPFISVNVSGKQLLTPDFVGLVREIIQETGIDPQLLKLEITETILMGDAKATIAALSALRALNVRLAIDDFGTGYSSLSYLSRFPVNTLKIDMSFVRPMITSPESQHIVRIIGDLGRSLGLDVIAEGVETSAHARILAELGVAYGQGWLFGKPMFADVVEEFMLNWDPPQLRNKG